VQIQNMATRALLVAIACVLPACSPACFLKPTEAFDAEKLAAAPDYSQPEAWAALPGGQEKAGFAPPRSSPADEPPADVFFVHPTTWFDREVWNDPLDSQKAREMVDDIIMPGQASAFNGCCRIFAPRFRQATIGAYFAEPEEASQAFSVAYSDVERAFETFVQEHNDGRPFILAGHSQGSMHAMRLLERIDADEALRERLIAAYIPGFAHPMSRFETAYEHLEPCDGPEQTGCVVSWDTYSEGTEPDGADPLVYWTDGELAAPAADAERQCTNPVSWGADEEPSPADAHLGAVKRINEGESPSFWKILRSSEPLGLKVTGLQEPRQGLFAARCEDGVLRVPDLDDLGYEPTETSPGNYHLLDYELFYMDVRQNALLRTEAWLEKKGTQTPPQARDGDIVASMEPEEAAQSVKALIEEAGPDQELTIEMRTTLDYGCPCPTWTLAPFHNGPNFGLPYIMVLPADGLERDPTEDALATGVYRMRGHFDGRTLSGTEWAEARPTPTPNFSDNIDVREQYWDSSTGPAFIVKEWCYLADSRVNDIAQLRSEGVPLCDEN
jgi:hypothetical protein